MSLYSTLPKIETEFVDGDIPERDYGKIIHLDIETSGLDPHNDELWVINIGYDPIEDGTFQKSVICRVPGEESAPKQLEKLITGDTFKVIHNAAFDASWIKVKWGITVSNVLCTKVLARLSRRTGNSYAKLVKVVTGLDLPKGAITLSPWNLPFNEWSNDMKNYCSYDVAFGYKIYKYFKDIASDKDIGRYDKIHDSWPHILEALEHMDYRDLRLL
jgi:ribonuclease D